MYLHNSDSYTFVNRIWQNLPMSLRQRVDFGTKMCLGDGDDMIVMLIILKINLRIILSILLCILLIIILIIILRIITSSRLLVVCQ